MINSTASLSLNNADCTPVSGLVEPRVTPIEPNIRRFVRKKLHETARDDFDRVFACQRQHILAMDSRLNVEPAQRRKDFLFDEFRLALFDNQHGPLAQAK